MIKISLILEEFAGGVIPRVSLEDTGATELEKLVMKAQKDTFKRPLQAADKLIENALEQYQNENKNGA